MAPKRNTSGDKRPRSNGYGATANSNKNDRRPYGATPKRGERQGGAAAAPRSSTVSRPARPTESATVRNQTPARGERVRSMLNVRDIVRDVIDRKVGRRGPAMGPPTNPGMTLDALIERIAGTLPAPTAGGGFSPALVDVNAQVKPFQDAQAATQQLADKNRGVLAQLAQMGQKDVQAVSQAAQARLSDLERMRAMQEARDLQAVQETNQASLGDLQAQGVDASVLAGAQAGGRAREGDAAAADEAMNAFLADAKTQADVDAVRRQNDQNETSRAATATLDQNLMAALLGLRSQEANARTQAEQFNAQATQEAQAANAAASQDYMAQMAALDDARRSLFPAVMEQAQSMGGFGFPGREQAMQTAMSTQGRIPQIVLQSIQSADNPDDALASVLDGIDVLNQERAKEPKPRGPINASMPWIKQIINQYYQQDTSRINPQVAQTLLQMYGVR